MSAQHPSPCLSRPGIPAERLEQAAAHDDLTAAVRLVQDEIGQTEGDIAGLFFDDTREALWASADRAGRIRILRDYVAFEWTFG